MHLSGKSHRKSGCKPATVLECGNMQCSDFEDFAKDNPVQMISWCEQLHHQVRLSSESEGELCSLGAVRGYSQVSMYMQRHSYCEQSPESS